jgi:hypothetical protein
MTRWRWALLIFELLLIALILVLPQVDLPDYTFHSGTAPVAAKARLSSASSGASVIIVRTQMMMARTFLEARNDSREASAHTGSGILLELLCTFVV